MLTKEELKSYQKIVGFNLWQVEKDYLQHLTLLFLYQRIKRELVFKGGTALQKVFGLNRFSIDLDFTSTNNKTEEILKEVAKDITNFGFPSELGKVEVAIGKTVRIKIKGPLYNGTERTITTLRLEISLRKDLIKKPIAKEIVPVYHDLRPYIVTVMDPEEILAEKIRAIIWRANARDLYDAWFLLRKNVKFDESLVNKKLSYYNLKFEPKLFFKKIESLKERWEMELKPLVNVLPPFENVRKDVVELMRIEQ